MTQGFLAFGSGDASIKLQDALTSFPSWVADGYATSDASTATGANFPGGGFNPNGADLDFSGMSYGSLADQGQISMDVSADFLAVDQASKGSAGINYGATRALFRLNSPSTGDIRFLKQSAMDIQVAWGSNQARNNAITGVLANPFITTQGKDTFARVGVSWKTIGSNIRLIFAVNGVILTEGIFTKTVEDFSNRITIGSDLGSSNMTGAALIKNLVISDESADFTTDRKIVMFGDSQVRNQSLIDSDGGYYDNNQSWNLLRELQTQGVYLDSTQVVDPSASVPTRYAGYPIAPSGSSGGDSLAAEIDAVLLEHNPTDVIFIGGTNDCLAPRSDEVELQASLEYILNAVAVWPNIERVCTVNVRSFIGDTGANAEPLNIAYRDDVMNPMLAAVSGWPAVNAYTLQGAESPPAYTYIGQEIDPGNNLHLAMNGAGLEGTAYAQTLAAITAGSPTLTTPYSIGNADEYGPKSSFYQNYTRSSSNITGYNFSQEFSVPFNVGDMMWSRLSDGWFTLRFISATNVEVL